MSFLIKNFLRDCETSSAFQRLNESDGREDMTVILLSCEIERSPLIVIKVITTQAEVVLSSTNIAKVVSVSLIPLAIKVN